MTPRGANVLTALGLLALIGALASTAPYWARRLRQPVPGFEDETGAAAAGSGRAEEADVERKISVKLFFEDPDRGGLVSEERTVSFSNDLSRQVRVVVDELIRGSATGLVASLGPDTRILEVFVSARGVAYVDLSKAVADGVGGGSKGELLTVYAIVNSVTANFPSIKRVQILVEDHPVMTLAGHVDLSRPLPPDMTYLAALPSPSPAAP